MKHQQHKKGESILEILLAVAIFAIVLPAILYTMGALASSQPERNIFFDALVYTEETKNTIQQLKSANWDAVATSGDYSLETLNDVDTLVPVPITPTPDARGFSRIIHIEDVRRNNGIIVSEGGVVDGATKKITIDISWVSSQLPITTVFYITRSDSLSSLEFTNSADFSQGAILLNGTKIQPSGAGDDAEITLDVQEPEVAVGLKSWWKMSGEYSASQAEIDAAPNGTNNLQIFGNPAFASGRFNKVVTLTSSSEYMVASSSASLELTGQLTVAAWVRSNTVPNNAILIHKLTSTGGGFQLGVDNLGKVSAYVGNGTTSLVAKDNNRSILGGLWHHVVSTYDGSKLLVFIDGTQGDIEGDGIDVLAANTEPLYVGKNPAYTNRNFTGDIDDVQIYNTALTGAEIEKLLYSTYTSNPINLTKSVLFHTIGAAVYQPINTKVRLQVAITEPTANSCESAYYKYVGYDGTESTYFDALQTNEASVLSVLPSSPAGGTYVNPGQCLRWKAYLYSATDTGSDDPKVKDVRITHTQ